MPSNHHAHLYIGPWDREALTRELLSHLGLSAENNPDLVIHEGPMGIDEARVLSARVATRPFSALRVLIIDASDMTLQAQNALLKTLEEPGEGNKFFLVAPYEDALLPTLRSRLAKVNRDDSESRRSPSDFDGLSAKNRSHSPEAFLNLSPAKRLDFAKKFKDDERQLGPFLDALMMHLKGEGREEDVKKVFTLRRYADDTSADARLILEHLSLVLK